MRDLPDEPTGQILSLHAVGLRRARHLRAGAPFFFAHLPSNTTHRSHIDAETKRAQTRPKNLSATIVGRVVRPRARRHECAAGLTRNRSDTEEPHHTETAASKSTKAKVPAGNKAGRCAEHFSCRSAPAGLGRAAGLLRRTRSAASVTLCRAGSPDEHGPLRSEKLRTDAANGGARARLGDRR